MKLTYPVVNLSWWHLRGNILIRICQFDFVHRTLSDLVEIISMFPLPKITCSFATLCNMMLWAIFCGILDFFSNFAFAFLSFCKQTDIWLFGIMIMIIRIMIIFITNLNLVVWNHDCDHYHHHNHDNLVIIIITIMIILISDGYLVIWNLAVGGDEPWLYALPWSR